MRDWDWRDSFIAGTAFAAIFLSLWCGWTLHEAIERESCNWHRQMELNENQMELIHQHGNLISDLTSELSALVTADSQLRKGAHHEDI